MAVVRDKGNPSSGMDEHVKGGHASGRLSRSFVRVTLSEDYTVPQNATAVYVDEEGTVICTDEDGNATTFTIDMPGFLPVIPKTIDADSTVTTVLIAY